VRIDNPSLRWLFSGNLVCEYCRRPAFGGTQCAHVFSRGAGHVDIPGNLVSLCASCHHESHNGRLITRADLLRTAAEREGLLPEEIEDVVHELRRWPKDKALPERLKKFL
jgi:hypothetical protein